MMNLHALVVLTVTQIPVVAQKYKKLEVYTSLEVIKKDISVREKQFVFEVKSSKNFDIAFYNNGDEKQWLVMRPGPSNLFVEIRKGPNSVVISQSYVELAMLDKFQKFKFIWNHHGNVSLWTTDSPGWRLLHTQEDPDPYLKGFDSVKMYSESATWKIYQIEHSTEPISSTCVNF